MVTFHSAGPLPWKKRLCNGPRSSKVGERIRLRLVHRPLLNPNLVTTGDHWGGRCLTHCRYAATLPLRVPAITMNAPNQGPDLEKKAREIRRRYARAQVWRWLRVHGPGLGCFGVSVFLFLLVLVPGVLRAILRSKPLQNLAAPARVDTIRRVDTVRVVDTVTRTDTVRRIDTIRVRL